MDGSSFDPRLENVPAKAAPAMISAPPMMSAILVISLLLPWGSVVAQSRIAPAGFGAGNAVPRVVQRWVKPW